MAPRKLSADAMRALVDYEWPGNVRELENSIERGVVLSSGPVIGSDLLPGHITRPQLSGRLCSNTTPTPRSSISSKISSAASIIEKLERCNWNQTDAAEQFPHPVVYAESEDQAHEHRDSQTRKRIRQENRTQQPGDRKCGPVQRYAGPLTCSRSPVPCSLPPVLCGLLFATALERFSNPLEAAAIHRPLSRAMRGASAR